MRSKINTDDQTRPSFIEAARRAQIIECAISAIAELGFAQASLAQIAKRAGVSTGVISYYFDGRDDLIRAVGAHVYSTGESFIRPLVDDEAGAAAALRTFIKASVAFVGSHQAYARAIMNIVRSGRDDRGDPLFDPRVEEPRQAGFLQILEWGQRTGEFRPFSARVMMVTIVEALDAVAQQAFADPNLDFDIYAEELATLFDHATHTGPAPQGENQ